jgi:predicted Zn finger-like uncharacterized protein
LHATIGVQREAARCIVKSDGEGARSVQKAFEDEANLTIRREVPRAEHSQARGENDMSIALKCPSCGKRYELEDSLAGKKVRCSGCQQTFRIGSMGPAQRPVIKKDEAAEPIDHSWLSDGAQASESQPPPIRRRMTVGSSGPSLGLLIGLGASGAMIVGVISGLLVVNSGPRAVPEPAKAKERSIADRSTPSLTDRILGAVSGTPEPSTDAASYPQIGPLLPPLLPPPPLRDLSAHERQTRIAISYLGQLNSILATVHDSASLKAAGVDLKSRGDQMGTEMRRNEPSFRLTAAEEAELLRRLTGEIRREMDRFRQESLRISTVPGLGIAGAQLVALVSRMSIPMELALKRSESFKQPTGPAPYAEVYVQLARGDDEIVCRQRLRGLLEGATGIQSSSKSDTRRASYRVWPVSDIRAFSRKISFGKATVKDRSIFLVADPISAADVAAAREAEKKEEEGRKAAALAASSHEAPNDPKPPVGADDVTKALYGLRSSRQNRRKDAVRQLDDLAPTDERRVEVMKQLLPLLDDTDDFFVIDVMHSMARWRTDEIVPALIKKLDHPSHGVRWKAEEILGKLGDARAAEPLAKHLKEDGIAAAPALRALGPAAEPALISLLTHPDPDMRRHACDILKDLGGKEALQAMMALPADRDGLVRMAAGSAMQAIRQRVGPVALPKKGSAKGKSR